MSKFPVEISMFLPVATDFTIISAVPSFLMLAAKSRLESLAFKPIMAVSASVSLLSSSASTFIFPSTKALASDNLFFMPSILR